MRRNSILLMLAMWLIGCVPVWAQYRAGLQGSVTDPQGAAVPGATVTITDVETNQSQSVQSTASGAYTFNRLAPAMYTVSVDASGFAKKTVSNVQIQGEQMQSLNLQLQLGEATQSVTVTDTTPAIDTETGAISGTISARELQSLPSANRDPYQLLRLVPGVTSDASQSAGGGSYSLPGNGGIGGSSATGSIFQVENRPQAQANGVRVSGNDYQVDGNEVNSLAWGGGAVITPNEESVKQVQVQSNPYDATNGRNSGAQVLVVSKNGTNDWHGSAFFKLHRPGLDAYQPYNGPNNPVVRDNNRFNQMGGSVGGPIVHNHLFFFFSYETLRNGSTSQTNNWYETPNFDTLGASAQPGSVAAAILGHKGEGAAYSVIANKTCANINLSSTYCQPATANGVSGLDIGSPLKTARGTPDPTYVSNGEPGVGSGLDGIPDIFYVQTSTPSNSVEEQYNGRLDYQITSHDLVAYSVYWVPTSASFYNGPARPANFWHSDHLSYSHAFLYDHTFSPTLLNEFRLNAVRWYYNEIQSNPQEAFGLPQDSIDTLGNASLQFFGAPGPGDFHQTTYNIRDTVTKTIGAQDIRVGFDGLSERDNDSQSYAAIPTYSFRNLWNFANDAPYSESGNFDPRTGAPTSATKYIRSAIYAAFVQDDWKIRPNLTLNLGLRWEYFGPISERNNNISNTVLGTGAATLTDARLKVGGNLYSTSKNNWGPQIGFAWSPRMNSSHQQVVRGGFGIGYNRMQEAITLNGRSNPPLVTSLAARCTDIAQTNCPGVLYAASSSPTNINGYPVNPAAIQTFGPNGFPVGGAAINITGLPQNLATPVTYRYSLQMDYAITPTWIATLGYAGNMSRHYTRQLNLNYLFYPNLNPQVNNFYYFTNDVNANSNAMLAEIKHTYSHSFQVDAQYRWGKVLDEGSQDYFIDLYPFNVRAAYGPADYDVTQNLKVFGIWSPKLFPNQKWLERIAGGWQISPIVQVHTGFPWTPTYSNTSCSVVYTNSGYCQLRPAFWNHQGNQDRSNDAFKRVNGEFPLGALSYFTVPTFPATGAPPPPGVGRNSLRGPRYLDSDVTAEKTFGIPPAGHLFGENAGLTIRADIFNLFNNLDLNPASITTDISSDGVTSNPEFGRPQSALGARTIEFQARFSF